MPIRSATARYAVVGVFLTVAGSAAAQAPNERSIGDEINVVRWREDYSFLRDRTDLTPLERLKFLPLNEPKTVYLIEWAHGGSTLTAFAGRPVDPKKRSFDSRPSGKESFWNVDWSVLRAGTLPNTEVFYFGRDLQNAVFGQGIGKEVRHNLGGRLWGRVLPWDYSVQASYQFGTFKDASIRAWGIATDTGYSIAALTWRPRVALRADVASGDSSAHDDVLQTFEAPYPALNYFSEAAIFAPGNSYDLHPYLQVQPVSAVTAEIGVTLLRRIHKDDAIYRAGGGLLIPPGVSDGSSVTDIFQIDVTWKPIPFLALQGAFVRAPAGKVVSDAGGKTTTFGLLQTDLRF